MNLYDTEKLILVDCDGVLLNWEFAFKVFMNKKGYSIKYPDKKVDYGLQHQYDIARTLKEDLVEEFNTSAAMGFLPPLRDAVEYVQRLHREQGFVFHVITAMSEDHYACELRRMNLEKLFGNVFEGFTFLGTSADKTDALSKYRDTGLLWIEDNLNNAVVGKKLGLESMLMAHAHNMYGVAPRSGQLWDDSVDIPRYDRWKQVYHHIVGD